MEKQRLKDLAKFILQLLALDDLLQSPLPAEDIMRLESEIQHLVIDGREPESLQFFSQFVCCRRFAYRRFLSLLDTVAESAKESH
jgi:hypothetical protein